MESSKLKVRWSKRDSNLLCNYPLGIGTVNDLHYLFGYVFNKEVQKELEARGYDIKTLKFEIQADPLRRPEKFQTLAKQIAEK